MDGKRDGETIHAGQFMSTRIHDLDVVASSDEEAEIDVVTSDNETETGGRGQKLSEKPKPIVSEDKPVTFYKFGPRQTRSIAIDVSLGKLNKCINFAYKRLTTPRWKYFHGLKLSWKERLRLNNVIWRSWHMEFVGKQSPKYCCYSVPLEDNHHQQSEAAVLEGMYWKRRLDAVCAQYKRWRIHATTKVSHPRRQTRLRRRSGNKGRPLDRLGHTHSDPSIKLQEKDINVYVPHPPPVIGSSADTDTILGTGGQFYDKDDLDNYFTDRLFDSLNQTSYMFPDHRELQAGGHSKNADFIQPSLLTLQPSLEDIMASLGEEDSPPMYPDDNPFRPFDYPSSFFGGKGKGNTMRTIEEEQTSAATAASYTSKDYEDAALLLPHSNYNPNISQGLTYSQAMSTFDAGMGMSEVAGMGPPNHPSGHYPTPSKGALKAYPAPPPHVQGHRVRAKRAKLRAQEEMEAAAKLSVRDQPPPQFMTMSSMVPSNNAPPASAFTPVPHMTSPYRSGHSSLSPGSPPHRLQPGQAMLGFLPHNSTQINQLQHPILLVKPSRSPVLPNYQYNQLQMSPLPSPTSATSSTPSRSPATSPQHQFSHILPNGPIKKEPIERSSQERSSKRRMSGTKRAAADSTMDPSERKRMLHLHAEQSRRSALKSGFDQLEEMLPNHNPGAKNTNASILARASEHIAGIKQRVEQERSELEMVQERVGQMKERIRLYQTEMPTTSGGGGASLPSLATTFVRNRTKEDWKFALLWRLCSKLWRSFVTEVTLYNLAFLRSVLEVEGKSAEELAAAARDWAAKYCNIIQLRPEMSSMLVELATECPSILSDPSTLPSAVISLASRINP